MAIVVHFGMSYNTWRHERNAMIDEMKTTFGVKLDNSPERYYEWRNQNRRK